MYNAAREILFMKLRFIAGAYLLFILCLGACYGQPVNSGALPKVGTVTAFIRMDRQLYRSQVEKALTFLRVATAERIKAGYEVETIRITTQPFPEYTKGLTPGQALAFFHEYDELAQKEGFTPDIGPAMVKDSDDPAQADLLAQIIATTQSLNDFI